MVKKAVRVYIKGIVQGVFFRKFVKENADKLGVNGYVRNLEDGNTVEAWFEGDNSKVDEMVDKCKNGPEHAVVKRLDVVDEKFQDRKGFKIITF